MSSNPILSDTPPPGLVPHAVPGAPPPPAAPTPAPTGKTLGLSLSREWVDWVPIAALTIALLMTVLPWVGSYPGGVRVYSQTPWSALAADLTVNSLPSEVLNDEKEIKARLYSSWWMLPYLPLLILAIVLIWAERFAPPLDRDKVPNGLEFLADYWHLRLIVLAGLATVLLALLEFQMLQGFGLESAVYKLAADQSAAQLTREDMEARNPKPMPGEIDKTVEEAVKRGPTLDSRPKQDRYSVYVGRRVGSYVLQGTTARDVAIAGHILAVAALLVRIWLDRRGTKPPPRIEVRS